MSIHDQRHSRLGQQARDRGVAITYHDWHGRTVDVPDDTLAAILDALGPGLTQATQEIPPAAVAPWPSQRQWGLCIQLYSVRSRRSWGHGDFRDLADLASWSARDLGADFVLVNPLHAAEPLPPVSPSPYLPMTRHYLSPLYLRIEDIPEYAELSSASRGRIEQLAAPLRAASSTRALIDRDAVWTAKRTALELIKQVPLSARRQADFDTWRAGEGRALADWALWSAIAEIHGPDWRSWPAELATLPDARPGHGARFEDSTRVEEAACPEFAGAAAFHAWVQWLAAAQAADAQAAAKRAGMRIGVIADLAVGAHPGGADAWARKDVIVPGVSVGAPPDAFNQRGQDWSLPPWHPEHLAATGAQPLAELIAATTRHAGGLRVDHVMGLGRLWWIPAGMPPDRGAYVRYDHQLMGGVLAAGAARANAVAIGEDLGTVEPWFRDFLAGRHVLGTSVLWFERGEDGRPRPPHAWRRGCLATVGTHDLPPAAAFLTGDHVRIRAELGLLTRPEAQERAAAAADLDGWLATLAGEGLLPAGAAPSPAEFTAALYGYLARTPAMLIGVSLAEATGERTPQNMPGTTDEYPNWRIPLSDGEGGPVLLEDLPAHAGVASVISRIRGSR